MTLIVAGCAGAPPRQTDVDGQVFKDDSAFALEPAAEALLDAADPPHITYELAVIHILVPREAVEPARKVWSLLREDALDAETQLRLRQNGVRVGVGRVEWWEPIKTALEAVEGCEVAFATPVRMPVGFVLSLELDTGSREQTLFYLGRDGYLSGSTIPASRNVLRISHTPDPRDYRGVQLMAVPEVHRGREGWEWVRREAGLTQGDGRSKVTYDAVGFVVNLKPGEFALIAPSETADIYGLLGGVFLTREVEGALYDSYIFLRPEARQTKAHE